MKGTKNIDLKITNNYLRASSYLNTNNFPFYFRRVFWSLIFIGVLFVDYQLSYGFFSNLARNEYGIVPDDLITAVRAKSFLGTSIVLILEYTFIRLFKPFQKLVYLCLFILVIIALVNIGRAQIYPLLYDYIQNKYSTEDSTNDAFSKLIGLSTDTAQQPATTQGDKSLEESVSKKDFLKYAKWYAFAFLLFSFVGLVAILNLAQNEKKAEPLSKAKHVVARYRILEQLELQRKAHEDDISHLENNRENLILAAKEENLVAYTCGLRQLKIHLHNLIIHAEKNRTFSVYKFWQIRRVGPLYPMNIEETKEKIKKAEERLNTIRLFDCANSIIENIYKENNCDVNPEDLKIKKTEKELNLQPVRGDA